MDTFAKRLKSARLQRGLTQDKLALLAGLQQSDISKMERGATQRTANLIALAKALAVNPDWLDSGDGDGPPALAQPEVLQAHSLSLTPLTLAAQSVTWEWLVTAKVLPGSFMVSMPDASLAGEIAEGDELVFEVERKPKVGKAVVIEDETTGRRYIRLYAEGKDGWRAVATSDAYVSFDSTSDRIKVLAALSWRR